MTEKELQSAVDEILQWKSWLTYHTHDSRRSAPGFPDLVAVKDSRVIYIEFKSEKGKVSDAQLLWLDRLVRAHCEVYLVRPSTEAAFHENVNVVGANVSCLWRNVRQGGKDEVKTDV